jgi:glycosyltransferase involved in cell wall biosynthesis
LVDLGDAFPHPSPEQRQAARMLLEAIPTGCPIVIDGLAFGVLPDVAAELRSDHPLIALVHHPLALESGLSAKHAADFRASERGALASATRVIVTSATTARLLVADYDVPAERVAVARPGTDPVAPARGSRDGVIRLLAVGAIVPRKGYDVLIAALATLSDLCWQLTIAGDRTRDPEAVARLDAEILRRKLSDRVALPGAVPNERLSELYLDTDVFTLASRYEGYGMVFSEAIAHGLPVIGTSAGAIAETVPPGAGLLVPPDDVDALAKALRRLIENPEERRRMASTARAAAPELPTWRDSAKVFAGALEAIA